MTGRNQPPTPSTAAIERALASSPEARHSNAAAGTLTRRHVVAGVAAAAGLSPAIARSASALATPAMVRGPFYPGSGDLLADRDGDLAVIDRSGQNAAGQLINLTGRLLDGGGAVREGVVEIWQADGEGRYRHSGDRRPQPLDENFQGFGRVTTDIDGAFHFRTIKPGAYPLSAQSVRAPHLHVRVALAGNERLITQLFFEDDPLNEGDVILSRLTPELRDLVMIRLAAGTSAEAGSLVGTVDIMLE
jgi:protocatechuate 3,4-dioxygenase beta subunit